MTKNYVLIHVVAEIVVLMIVTIYFQRKLSRLTGQVRDLYTIINNQQTMINRHEQMLSQILGVRPQTFTIPPQENTDPVVTTPAPAPKPASVMPMVESLLGMLGTVTSIAHPPEDNPPPRAATVDVDKELMQELKELNEMRKDEGRIEHLENVATATSSPTTATTTATTTTTTTSAAQE